MIILKVTKNGFTLFLEDTFLQKPQCRRIQILNEHPHPPSTNFLGLRRLPENLECYNCKIWSNWAIQ